MSEGRYGKLIIFSAPSGAGKTTIVRCLMERFPRLEFSISATSRKPRSHESHGRDYYFFTQEAFEKAVSEDSFVEWEEVYAGMYYGTLHSELNRIWNEDKDILFDVDVKGGMSLKERFGSRALSVFVMPPSINVLRSRLASRGTESDEEIAKRVAKAEYEIGFARRFDYILVNDNLDEAVNEISWIVSQFLNDM